MDQALHHNIVRDTLCKNPAVLLVKCSLYLPLQVQLDERKNLTRHCCKKNAS